MQLFHFFSRPHLQFLIASVADKADVFKDREVTRGKSQLCPAGLGVFTLSSPFPSLLPQGKESNSVCFDQTNVSPPAAPLGACSEP